jgi:hypothetical protein
MPFALSAQAIAHGHDIVGLHVVSESEAGRDVSRVIILDQVLAVAGIPQQESGVLSTSGLYIAYDQLNDRGNTVRLSALQTGLVYLLLFFQKIL